jgi:hypothetical protein
LPGRLRSTSREISWVRTMSRHRSVKCSRTFRPPSKAVGADFRHVIKLNYYCVDTVEPAVALPAIKTVRDSVVNSAAPPASTFVVIRKLDRNS